MGLHCSASKQHESAIAAGEFRRTKKKTRRSGSKGGRLGDQLPVVKLKERLKATPLFVPVMLTW